MKRVCSVMAMALLGVACVDQTSVQRAYISQRNECQGVAENRLEDYLNPFVKNSEQTRNATLVTLFSDCMFDRGWTVAAPDREKTGVPAPESRSQQQPITVRR